jgi:hypothetical protein
MAQQQTQADTPVEVQLLTGSEQLGWLTAEVDGRERLRQLLQQWQKRNGWSLAVMSRLAELSLLAEAKVPVPDWLAGMPLQPGNLVNHRGHAWEAVGNPLSEPAEGAAGWIDRGLTSRLHASGLNLYFRNQRASLMVSFLLEVGRLNEWIARVQAGTAQPPADERLNELVMGSTVIRDSEGPLGPEEFLSIAGSRLQPPPWPDQPAAPADVALVPARQLRAAAAAAGLDIIDDWATIAQLYPSNDPDRLKRLQKVLQGLAQWDAQQEEDERVAAHVLLHRLQDTIERLADQAADQPAAGAVIPAVVQEISGASS